MIVKLTRRNNSIFLYLTKTMMQLLHIEPENAYFIFTLKNKTLYIAIAENDQKNSSFVKKIRKTGGGWGIYISKTMLEFIDVNPDTDNVEVNIEEETIILKKAN